MSKYNFKIENYHAIGHADIDIDGITVIAGGNGCGKSTLSRWLYYIIQTITKYNQYLFANFCKDTVITLDTLSSIAKSLDFSDTEGYTDIIAKASSLISIATDGDVENVTLYYNKAIETFCKLLEKYLTEETDVNNKKRILKILGLESEELPLVKLKLVILVQAFLKVGKCTLLEFNQRQLLAF